jgi:hypothetical protein
MRDRRKNRGFIIPTVYFLMQIIMLAELSYLSFMCFDQSIPVLATSLIFNTYFLILFTSKYFKVLDRID